MHESESDLRALQDLLDRSYAAAGLHLRSVFRPERRMAARDVVDFLSGIFVLHVATVSAAGHPLVAPVDGLFFRGSLYFGFPPGSVRAGHVRARPRVSAATSRGESHCVIAHGLAREVDLDAAEHADLLAFFREQYGDAFDYWHREHYADREGRGLDARLEPRHLFAMKPAEA